MSRQCKPFLAFRFGFLSDSVFMLLLSTYPSYGTNEMVIWQAVTYVQVPCPLETSQDSQSGGLE